MEDVELAAEGRVEWRRLAATRRLCDRGRRQEVDALLETLCDLTALLVVYDKGGMVAELLEAGDGREDECLKRGKREKEEEEKGVCVLSAMWRWLAAECIAGLVLGCAVSPNTTCSAVLVLGCGHTPACRHSRAASQTST